MLQSLCWNLLLSPQEWLHCDLNPCPHGYKTESLHLILAKTLRSDMTQSLKEACFNHSQVDKWYWLLTLHGALGASNSWLEVPWQGTMNIIGTMNIPDVVGTSEPVINSLAGHLCTQSPEHKLLLASHLFP